jgi:Initiator Replication protein
MEKALHLVKPTGDLMKEPDKDATLPVPLPIVMVQVKGPFTALDRKLWALCLHLGWEELETKSKVGEWHEIQEVELRRLIEKFSGTKGMNWIWESAQRLTETTVRYSRVDTNDKRWKGVTSLFSAEMPEEEEKDGVFRYMFPPQLVPIFREPGRFARLRVQFLLGLKSKYAVTLYELFEGVANKRVPTIEATVDELRQWLQVPEGKLTQWIHLWQKALKPGLDEINADPKETGFSVSCELKRGGRGNRVKGVKLTVTKVGERIGLEKGIQVTKKAKEAARISRLIPPFNGTAIYTKAKKIAPQFDIYYLEKEWRDWVSQSDVVIKTPEAHFMAFVKKKVGK